MKVPVLTSEDPARLFAAIGLIVVKFQQMEWWLTESLVKLLSISDRQSQFVVLAAMSFRQKVDLWFVLSSARQELPRYASLECARDAPLSAEEYRNRIVHSNWAPEGEVWVRQKSTLRSKKGLGVVRLEVDLAHMEESAKQLFVITQWRFRSEADLKSAVRHLKEGFNE